MVIKEKETQKQQENIDRTRSDKHPVLFKAEKLRLSFVFLVIIIHLKELCHYLFNLHELH